MRNPRVAALGFAALVAGCATVAVSFSYASRAIVFFESMAYDRSGDVPEWPRRGYVLLAALTVMLLAGWLLASSVATRRRLLRTELAEHGWLLDEVQLRLEAGDRARADRGAELSPTNQRTTAAPTVRDRHFETIGVLLLIGGTASAGVTMGLIGNTAQIFPPNFHSARWHALGLFAIGVTLTMLAAWLAGSSIGDGYQRLQRGLDADRARLVALRVAIGQLPRELAREDLSGDSPPDHSAEMGANQ